MPFAVGGRAAEITLPATLATWPAGTAPNSVMACIPWRRCAVCWMNERPKLMELPQALSSSHARSQRIAGTRKDERFGDTHGQPLRAKSYAQIL